MSAALANLVTRKGRDGALDGGRDGSGEIGTDARQRPRDWGLVRASKLSNVAARDWIRPGQQMEEQDAETVEVALDRRRTAREDFRRQIQRRPGDTLITAELLPARAEVHQHHAAVVREHHVLGLHVTMEKAGLVHGREGLAQLDAHVHDFVNG